MSKSKIEWTEVVWNPVTGCSKVSPGCKNCYAETIAYRFWGERKFTDVICHEDRLEQPFHWKKPRMIFVNSMSDLFHEDVPFEFIGACFDVMRLATQHTYQILTKRPGIMLDFFKWVSRNHKNFTVDLTDNIWLGVSVENQKTADERIPLLLQTPAKVRWISAEPLLKEINIEYYLREYYKDRVNGYLSSDDAVRVFDGRNKLDWVVVGGESGQNKRPFDCDWARSLRDQCKAAGVPYFFKQIDKVQPIPEDLMIREYPKNNQIKGDQV